MTNSTKFRALLLGSAVALACSAVAQPATTMQGPAMQRAVTPAATVEQGKMEGLELLDKIGSYTGPVMSYQAVRPTPAHIQDVVKLSGRLGAGAGVKFGAEALKGDEVHKLWNSASDHSALFQVDTRTGNFIFEGGMNRYRKDASTKGLPTEQAAAEAARGKLAELGLKPEGGEVKLAHVGGLDMGVTDGKGNTKIYEKLRTVRFSRVLGGLPVEGDSRIVVQLGEGGAVSGLFYQWPTVNETKLGRDALADGQSMKSRALETIRAGSAKAVRSKLVTADLVLYDDGAGVIEPAYHFVVQQYFAFPPGALTMNPFDFYLPALRNSNVNLPKINAAAKAPVEDRGQTKPTNNMQNMQMQHPAGQ